MRASSLAPASPPSLPPPAFLTLPPPSCHPSTKGGFSLRLNPGITLAESIKVGTLAEQLVAGVHSEVTRRSPFGPG